MADLTNYLTADELNWVNKFYVYMQRRAAKLFPIVFRAVNETKVPDVIEDFEQLYYHGEWSGWVRELLFKSHMQHRPNLAESTFLGWHKVESFAVTITM